jgi:polyhydroxybutyrate depolymerase
MLDQLAGELAIDQDWQFVMGLSNGGGMAHRLACDLGDRFRAAAMVAGVYPAGSPCAASAPIPILAFHGDADSVVPYAGGGANNLLPIPDWAAAWADRNGCQEQQAEAAAQYRYTRWINCVGTSTVHLYTLTAWDHFWPDPANVPEDMADPGLDASALIWAFFAGE